MIKSIRDAPDIRFRFRPQVTEQWTG